MNRKAKSRRISICPGCSSSSWSSRGRRSGLDRWLPPRPLLSTYAVTPCARLEIANCRESRKNRKLGVKLTILAKKRETIATKAAKKNRWKIPRKSFYCSVFFFLLPLSTLTGRIFFSFFLNIVSRHKSSRLRLTDRNPPG